MTDYEERQAADTEPAPDERPTLPPSALEVEAAFRESQRPPMQTLTAGPRSLRSENALEPALAEMRGLRADIMAGFDRQAKADRDTRRAVVKAEKANAANHRIVQSAVQNLGTALETYQKQTNDRLAKLEAELARLADRVTRQEEALEAERERVRRNREQVEGLRAELEKARAAHQPPAPKAT